LVRGQFLARVSAMSLVETKNTETQKSISRHPLLAVLLAPLLGCSGLAPAGGSVAAQAGAATGGASGTFAGGANAGAGGSGASNANGGTASETGGTGGAFAGAGGAGANGGAAAVCPPSWTATASCGGGSVPPGAVPDFGSHVLIFDPSMSTSSIQTQMDAVNAKMDADMFDDTGYAYFFKPGQYGSAAQSLDVRVGYYMHVLGLGKSPDDVTITGAVRAKADARPDLGLDAGNATCNFWRTVENFSVVPAADIDSGTNIWAVSQATAMRRVHIKGPLDLAETTPQAWSSGGFIADSLIDGEVNSLTQQQFLSRNDGWGQWQGSNWNMVFVGDPQAPAPSWPEGNGKGGLGNNGTPPMTVVTATPVVREKPFLYLDDNGNYLVMVPALKTSSAGYSWAAGTPPGSPVSIDNFYIAKPSTDTAATLNAALAAGNHLLLTPGGYKLDNPIQITKPGTILLGLGLAVLTPTNGNAALTIADVDGVSVAGILIEAGALSTDTLLQAGPPGSAADHSASPTVLFDVHCRIGGNIAGTAKVCFTINSNDLIIDNTWLWRADQGTGADWNTNKSDSGLVVNGNDVTVYGLFVEHHQKYQTLWNGNGGQVFFYQSELPYDPPNQSAWDAAAGVNGYPSYKVADTVTSHHAQGIGIYAFFDNPLKEDNAIETPTGAGIVMQHLMTYSSGTGGVVHVVNGVGGNQAAAGTSYSN
jgi:hypothetical protein